MIQSNLYRDMKKKESEWSGDVENAYYSSEKFDNHRQLLRPEYEYSGRSSKGAYYVLGVDVGRKGCTSECVVFKVTPQAQGSALKSVVNIYTWEEEHFEQQAINIKRLFYKYKARTVVIDANGLGVGLVDFMVLDQIDPETGELLPNFGVGGATYEGWEKDYRQYKTENTERDAMFLMKANAPINTEVYSYIQSQMASGKVKFLIDENTAKVKLMSTKIGQDMDASKRAEYLLPFTRTTILKEQMLEFLAA